MPEPFSITFPVRWADLDPNGHVRHTVYMDLGAQTRLAYLQRLEFSVARMHREGIGPILFREEARYLREVRAGDRLTVDVVLTGVSANLKHWSMRHHLFRGDGEAACVVDCRGAWMDLRDRRVVPAPDELAEALEAMPRSEDYAEIDTRREQR